MRVGRGAQDRSGEWIGQLGFPTRTGTVERGAEWPGRSGSEQVEVAGRSAPGATMLPAVHPSEGQPGQTEEGEGDRDADLVQDRRPRGGFATPDRSRGPVSTGDAHVSVERAKDSVTAVTGVGISSRFRLLRRSGPSSSGTGEPRAREGGLAESEALAVAMGQLDQRRVDPPDERPLALDPRAAR